MRPTRSRKDPYITHKHVLAHINMITDDVNSVSVSMVTVHVV